MPSRSGVFRTVSVLVALVAGVLAAGAVAAEVLSDPPPAQGVWKAGPGPHPPHNFDGSLQVQGTSIVNLHGVMHRPPGNRDALCVPGEKVSIAAAIPIKHVHADGVYDAWVVPDRLAKITLSVHGHHHTSEGSVSFTFPSPFPQVGEPKNLGGGGIGVEHCSLVFVLHH